MTYLVQMPANVAREVRQCGRTWAVVAHDSTVRINVLPDVPRRERSEREASRNKGEARATFRSCPWASDAFVSRCFLAGHSRANGCGTSVMTQYCVFIYFIFKKIEQFLASQLQTMFVVLWGWACRFVCVTRFLGLPKAPLKILVERIVSKTTKSKFQCQSYFSYSLSPRLNNTLCKNLTILCLIRRLCQQIVGGNACL